MDTQSSDGDGPGRALLTTARREVKYIVDPVLVPPLRQFVQSMASDDPASAASPDHRYAICSLYLDTDDLHFYRQYANGARARFKLRARTYSDAAAEPVYLEVKHRVDRVVIKQRAVLGREHARSVLEGHASGASASRWMTRRALDAFTIDMALTAARPVVRVKYRREAYVAEGPAPARVTFDTGLEFQPTFGPTLAHEGGRWMPVPLDGVVLEVKYGDRLPRWIEDMIRAFGLAQRPCCKYALSIERMTRLGGAAGLRLAGFRLPLMTGWRVAS